MMAAVFFLGCVTFFVWVAASDIDGVNARIVARREARRGQKIRARRAQEHRRAQLARDAVIQNTALHAGDHRLGVHGNFPPLIYRDQNGRDWYRDGGGSWT